MERVVIVADNFYENPDVVRALALSVEYDRDQFTPNHSSKAQYCTPEVLEQFAKILGTRLGPSASSYHGRFRISSEGASRLRDVHVDHAQWNAIIYLNTPDQCRGGTSLWRHKATGWETFPSPEEIMRAGFKSAEEFVEKVLKRDGVDRSKWDEVMTVPMKYNRAILIRSNRWHSSTTEFGDRFDNSRLVQTFFLNEESFPGH